MNRFRTFLNCLLMSALLLSMLTFMMGATTRVDTSNVAYEDRTDYIFNAQLQQATQEEKDSYKKVKEDRRSIVIATGNEMTVLRISEEDFNKIEEFYKDRLYQDPDFLNPKEVYIGLQLRNYRYNYNDLAKVVDLKAEYPIQYQKVMEIYKKRAKSEMAEVGWIIAFFGALAIVIKYMGEDSQQEPKEQNKNNKE